MKLAGHRHLVSNLCRASQDHHYEHFGTLLDIPAFVDYLILQLWIANWDWPNNNWVAACERSDEGKFRFYLWDVEGTFESQDLNKVGFTTHPRWASGGGNKRGPVSVVQLILDTGNARRAYLHRSAFATSLGPDR